ncbi:ClpP-like prohead protease/major capsid protein fusion protein [Klebsiella oxytoca]
MPKIRAYQRPKASVKSNSWFRMKASANNEADIYIYDEIGYWGVTAKQFVNDLKALGDVSHINLHINSPGGDVFDGIAIFNALKHHGAAITVHIDGLAASMASVIAMVGNQCIADPDCTVEQAKDVLLAALGKVATPSNKSDQPHIYAGNGNFVGDGIRQALMARAGYENQERDNVYNGMTLREYARMALTERGIGVSSYNPMQMVGLALTHSTSDFGNILLDVANKALLQGWDEAAETFDLWTKKGQLSDFKTAHRVGMGGFNSLRKVREGAEYKYVTTGDKGETIALATYGEIFSITRQAIINDDLNALTDVPAKMGRAAKATIGDLVYAILLDNPKLSDGKPLFHADHKNLSSGSISVSSIDDARKLMRLQKEGERSLNIRPAYMLVPVGLETLANQTIKSASVKGADINSGINNPIQNFAEVISEPRLDDKDPNAWYLAAAKGTDTIEVAYLNGVDTPYIDQQEGFNTDGIATKVRIDAGVAPLDFRGLTKSSGK